MLFSGVVCGLYLVPQQFAHAVPALWTWCNPMGFPFLRRFYSHHSHQPNMAHQDSSAAGRQVSRCAVWRFYYQIPWENTWALPVLSWVKVFLLSFCRNRGERRMSALECVRRVYQLDGLRGFYRGMSASYAGISETVIHFVIYESIKRRLLEAKMTQNMDEEEEVPKVASDFVGMMLAAATSKTCATTMAYPHGQFGSSFDCLTVLANLF